MKTSQELFNEMLEMNGASGWINPRMEPIQNPLYKNHFMIKMEDFTSIMESQNVSIYNIRKWPDEIVIHCQPDEINER